MAYTTIDNPGIYFNTKLYTGNGGTNAITGVGFQPDWVWLKRRDSSAAHYVWDVVRGAATQLYPASASSEDAGQTNGLSAFGSDGFTLGSDAGPNANSGTYASWNWKAGGSASSNSDGSITSSVSASTTAGFSIVSFTGNGSAGATIGHGLGAVPQVYILKNRSSSAGWTSYFEPLGNTKFLQLDTTGAAGTATEAFNNTSPTSSVFSIGTDTSTNNNTDNFIAYCFAEKKGYSKFGSYTGNGNADGTFVYTGFAPTWVMVKRTNGTQDWNIFDAKRPGYNPADRKIEPNTSDTESGAGNSNQVDLLSNGFKRKGTGTGSNGSGDTYIYMAFAESPFVNSNGVPTNAR